MFSDWEKRTNSPLLTEIEGTRLGASFPKMAAEWSGQRLTILNICPLEPAAFWTQRPGGHAKRGIEQRENDMESVIAVIVSERMG